MNETANAVMGTLSGRRTIIIKAACGHKVYGEANDMFAAENPRLMRLRIRPGSYLAPSVLTSQGGIAAHR